jgi:DNA helicase-2/ATP-dependent DNA helicase PcrA
VKDALAYLRLVMNPADEVAFARVANTPRRAFGDVSLTTFLTAARAQGSTPVAALYDEALLAALPRRVSAAAAKFAAMLDLVRAGATTGPVAACHAVLDAGLRECYRTDQERLENLDELLVFAESFTAQRSTEDPTLGPNELLEGFLEAAALASSTDVDERAPVSVITAHASKGREFDHVWVVGVEESVFPHQMSFPDGVEEERRLCFVALSRARSTLTVTYRRRHFLNGEWHDADRSRFLDLLGDTAVFSEEFPPNRPRLGGRSYPSHRPAPPSDRPVWRPEPARTPVARPQGPRLDVAQVHPGLSVHHNVFGTGTVESIAGSMAQIRFGAKTRTLDLNFAPLTTTPT